jgi:hypothetical protein
VERVAGSKASFTTGASSSMVFRGAVETARRCHDCSTGNCDFSLLGGISRIQYARFRIPMSILRIRVGCMEGGGTEVIPWWRRERRVGLVPVVWRPHLNARVFRCVSLRVLGKVRIGGDAIHVVGFELERCLEVTDWIEETRFVLARLWSWQG